MKKYLIFLLVCILGYMSAFAIGYAEWGNKKIEVEYRDISIIVNGKKIQTDVEPFIYNGRTFVPVRWVAEALDKKVGWNGDTWTVYIDDKKPSEKSPLKFDVIYTEKLTGMLTVKVKITNTSGRKIRTAEVTCILLNKYKEEIAFEKHYVIDSDVGLLPNDSTYFTYVISVEDPDEVEYVKFKIEKVYYS